MRVIGSPASIRRRNLPVTRTSLACFAALTITLSSVPQAATTHELWIRHVTVVSPERSAPLRDATVVVRDDRIVAINAPATAQAPDTRARVIEGKGLFLSPGLIDSHVHTNEVSGFGGSKPTEERFPEVVRALRSKPYRPSSQPHMKLTCLCSSMPTAPMVRNSHSMPALTSLRTDFGIGTASLTPQS